MRELFLLVCVLGAGAGIVIPAAAQSRPDDVQGAAAAFGEGQRAQLRGEYARAADFFELADRSAPSAPALRSAIRMHREAGQLARAATLARAALERYPEDAETRTVAEAVIAEAGPRLGEVRVTCAPACSLAIEGRAAAARARESFDLFVEPGSHALIASWSGHDAVTRVVEVAAGAQAEVALEPPAAAVAPDPEPDPDPDPGPIDQVIVEPAPPPASGGISPAFFGIATGLTVVTAGIGIWSGIDTLDARDRYVMDPTRVGYEDGVGRQWRTTGLFIAAGVCGAAAVVFAILTDWGGGQPSTETALLPWISIDPSSGALVGVGGSL